MSFMTINGWTKQEPLHSTEAIRGTLISTQVAYYCPPLAQIHHKI
jgi:hypothetical protein